jgi:hypothetical protein
VELLEYRFPLYLLLEIKNYSLSIFLSVSQIKHQYAKLLTAKITPEAYKEKNYKLLQVPPNVFLQMKSFEVPLIVSFKTPNSFKFLSSF